MKEENKIWWIVIALMIVVIVAVVAASVMYAINPLHYGYGMMGGWGMMGFGIIFMFVPLIFFILLIYAIISAPRYEYHHITEYDSRQGTERSKAYDILEERYAKGEITREQYLSMKEDIRRK